MEPCFLILTCRIFYFSACCKQIILRHMSPVGKKAYFQSRICHFLQHRTCEKQKIALHMPGPFKQACQPPKSSSHMPALYKQACQHTLMQMSAEGYLSDTSLTARLKESSSAASIRQSRHSLSPGIPESPLVSMMHAPSSNLIIPSS